MYNSTGKSKQSHSHGGYIWSEQYQQWYSERVDRHGNVHYDWHGGGQLEDRSVPRTDATPINSLTQHVGNLSLDHGSYSQNLTPRHQHQHTSSVSAAGDLSSSPAYTHASHKEKGKGVDQSDHYGGSSHGPLPTQSSSSTYNPTDSYGHSQYPTSEYPSSSVSGHGTGTTAATLSPQSASYQPSQGHFSSEDAQYQEAVRRSRTALYNQPVYGESSHSGQQFYGTSSAWPPSVDPKAYSAAGNDANATRDAVVAAPPSISQHISGTPGEAEYLDTRYRVEFSSRFQPGEVFKILWSEPLGSVFEDPISDIKQAKTPGGKFYVGYRRFLIVMTDESHHSTCVPILTYDRRGCGKKGVKPLKHGIIYEAGHKARPLKDEPELGYDPVALQIYADGEKLARESRINYSKLTTIEHNVKVFFIGTIAPDDFETVQSAWRNCLDQKHSKQSKKSRR